MKRNLVILSVALFGLLSCNKDEQLNDNKSKRKYYRIKQMDKDGHFNYSKVVTNGK